MLALLLVMAASSPKLSESVVMGVPVRSIAVDLLDPTLRLDVAVPAGFPGTDAPFAELAKGPDVLVAVNGAYFDKGTKLPIGDIVSEGRLLHSGRMGTAFTVSESGDLDIERVVRHRTMRWEGKRTVFACGPALVLDGEIDVQFASEGFRDPHVTGSAQRMAVGYKQDKTVLFVHIMKPVTFDQEAAVMKALGCYEAMNLDAGASLAMKFNGKLVTPEPRRLASVIVVRRVQMSRIPNL